MKRLILFSSVLFLLFLSCSNNKNGTVKAATNHTTVDSQSQPKVVVNSQPPSDTSKNGEVIILTTETFKKRIFDYTTNTDWNYLGDKPAIVDFYADWCRPCKMIEPYLDELAKEYAGKIYVYRINVDNNQEVAQVFGIRSIPAVLFIPMEGKPQMPIGAHPKDFYENAGKEVLKVQ